MNPQTVLVTGGAGFIGSALVRYLIRETDAIVVNVDRLTYAGNLESLSEVSSNSRYRFEQLDVCDGPGLSRIFNRYQPSAVMHLAAESHVDRSIDSPAEFVSTNVVGTSTLLAVSRAYWSGLKSTARQRFRFLQVSTDEVFGSLGPEGRFSEKTPYKPSSPYAASKAAADHLVRAWHRTYGLPVIVTNCSNNYGPYQFPEKLVPLMILSATKGQRLPIYGYGENVRDWLFVDDHVRGLWVALTCGEPGETYAFGGRAEKSNLEVVQSICSILDALIPDSPHVPHWNLATYVEDRPGHDFRYAIDSTKAECRLRWKSLESFESGLQKTIQWYLDNRSWCDRVQDGSYRGERLGLFSNRSSARVAEDLASGEGQ